jgi:hypothetical protein
VTAFGVSNVAPSGAVVGGLVIVVGTRGPRLRWSSSRPGGVSVLRGQHRGVRRRLPSAGSLYTYNSQGLGGAGGFLTGWMMVFADALYVPAGIALSSAYTSQLLAGAMHVTIVGWALFVVILAAVAGVAHLASALHPGSTWPWSPSEWP